ncbi:hypothetical protein [Ruania albidiflava]|uniref:hypothetical protein n=1 Tax=Ruania albidiflava TaxID=366586 RepID=UPI0012FB8963|nr:hypothetical protein [Ruania albidiflava]
MNDATDESAHVMRDLRLSVTGWNTRVIVREALARGIEVERLGPNGGVRLIRGNRRHWWWAEPLGSAVVKPRNAKRGAGVHVALRSRSAFVRAFRSVAEEYGSVLVEQHQVGKEFRFLAVGGRIVGVIHRRPASVVGDGRSTVEELVRAKNQDRGPVHKPLKLGEPELKVLARQRMRASSVPGTGLRVFLRNTLNLHVGADAVEAAAEISAEEMQVMERVAQAVPGAGVLGIDALVPRKEEDGGLGIIELNGAPPDLDAPLSVGGKTGGCRGCHRHRDVSRYCTLYLSTGDGVSEASRSRHGAA